MKLVNLNRIRELAKENKRSLSYLVSAIGLNSRTYFKDVEKSGRDIPDKYLRVIADELNTTVAYLRDETDDPVNYDDGDVLASIPLSYVEAANGDMRRAYKLMRQVDEDAQRDIAAHYYLDTYTDQEKALISAFRSVNDYGKLRIIQAVMNIKDDCSSEGIKVYRAARSSTDTAPTVETMSPEDLRKYQSAKKVTSEEDL